jgi:hypothetical protein
MRLLRALLLLSALVMAFGPPILFATLTLYVYWTNPIDQSGWGALVGGSMIMAMAVSPVGLFLLLVYAAVWGVSSRSRE